MNTADRDGCLRYKEQVPASELRDTSLTPFVKTLRMKKRIQLAETPEQIQQGVPNSSQKILQFMPIKVKVTDTKMAVVM